MLIPAKAYVHVVRSERVERAMQASRAQLEKRVHQRHGFGLEAAGALNGDELNREQAAVLAASVRAWPIGTGLKQFSAIASVDQELDAVRILLDELNASAATGLLASHKKNDEDKGYPGFFGVAHSKVIPAAAVALSAFSGPAGQRRLGARRNWLDRASNLAARRELASNGELWAQWDSFGAAVRYAWYRGLSVAVEGTEKAFVCFENE